MRTLTENERKLLIDSGLFDAEWYLEKYQDVQKVGLAPLEHFLRIGGFISRSPGPLFDAKYYLNQVAEEWEVVFPLLDYLEGGWKKNINPNPLFDIKWFLLTNSDIKKADIEPLAHYFHYGGFEGRNPHKSFNSKKVLEYLKERRLHNINPLSFYLSKEWTQDPCPEATLFLNKSDSDETNCGIYFDHILDNQFGIFPIYLNELQYKCNTIPSASIGVHLHLYYIDQLDNCIQYLKNIPSKFNLFISLCNEILLSVDKKFLQKELPLASGITIEVVPNRGRDIAPLIIQFGNRLLEHDYILHIHTKKSYYNDKLQNWGNNIFKKILGSSESVSSILALLGQDAKYVYPEEELFYVPDPSGWDANYEIATRCATKYGFLRDFNKYKEVRYPQGSMYWCTAKAATKFLSLPLTWDDFSEEPIPQDGTIAHALERLVFVLAESVRGKNYKIVNLTSLLLDRRGR